VTEAAAGAQLLAEIREQPAALRRLLEFAPEYELVAARMRERRPSAVRLAGHGSSDNAASYAVYAFGLLPGWTAMRDSVSLSVYYGAKLDLSQSCVIAFSQSGRTPDVVEYAEKARAQGALTIALTNDPTSALADVCEAVLPIGAGAEHAVAATKTYSTQIAAIALLAGGAADAGPRLAAAIESTANLIEDLLPKLEARVLQLALSLSFVGRMFVVGRGPEFATAREISLKLLETCRVAAVPLTATDLAHGPIAALDGMFPVWAIASDDASLGAVKEAAARVRTAGGTLIASGTAAAELEGAAHVLEVPPPPVGVLTPLLSVVPGQLLAWALAQAKGLDPDRPAGLSKITLAL
jgi:glucosamine--fructose-6-phosphate aminotransferase (isomerizing)